MKHMKQLKNQKYRLTLNFLKLMGIVSLLLTVCFLSHGQAQQSLDNAIIFAIDSVVIGEDAMILNAIPVNEFYATFPSIAFIDSPGGII